MHYAFSDGALAEDFGLTSPLKPAALAGANPGNLLMYRYKPEGLKPGAPLLVILHGCGQTAAGYDQGTGWSTLARRLGFAILAPEQVGANNMGTCFNWFLPTDTARGHGEAASIHQMVEETAREFASDPRRIFVTGLSAGGGMTSAMLASYPEVFAGGAIIAGLPHGAAANLHEALAAMRQAPQRTQKEWGHAVRRASPHKGPWPRVSVWHGDGDRTVNLSNRDAIVAQWRDIHGLSAGPKPVRQGNVLYQRWQDGHGHTLLESYDVPGLGHGVPIKTGADADAVGRPGPFILDAGISSSFQIAKFFGLTPATVAQPSTQAGAPSARIAPPPVLPPLPEPILAILKPDAAKASVKTVIVKALQAAGLMRKNRR